MIAFFKKLHSSFTAFLKRYFDIKFWRYNLIGFINTIVGIIIYYIATRLLYTSYDIAVVFQIVISNALGYYLNRKFNYKDDQHWLKSLLLYCFGVCFSWCFAYILLKEPVFSLATHTATGMLGENLAKVLPSDEMIEDIAMFYGLLIFISLNYSLQRFLTFRKADQRDYK